MPCELDGGPSYCAYGCVGVCRYSGEEPDDEAHAEYEREYLRDQDREADLVAFLVNDDLPVDVSDFVLDLSEEPADIPF